VGFIFWGGWVRGRAKEEADSQKGMTEKKGKGNGKGKGKGKGNGKGKGKGKYKYGGPSLRFRMTA
jgi:hypothetical protein